MKCASSNILLLLLAAPPLREEGIVHTRGPRFNRRESELGGNAGSDVRAPDVAARGPDVVLLVEVVRVLDRDLLVVVLGADALGVDGLDHGIDVLLPVEDLPAARPEVV